ncbi:hypothetical protein [Paenibacillus jamilae]|uniref:hypothetical protein n=1 Tax=Paenibacillus jamilae TaxID=114136 RepID=UPI001428974D|nr:hypothetical protein [Paenibacillus jamilae]
MFITCSGKRSKINKIGSRLFYHLTQSPMSKYHRAFKLGISDDGLDQQGSFLAGYDATQAVIAVVKSGIQSCRRCNCLLTDFFLSITLTIVLYMD